MSTARSGSISAELDSNISAEMGPRLSQVLFESCPRNFSTLAVVDSNVQAIEAGLLFASGIQPLVAVVGPSGWGKSHLLQAVANRIAEDEPVKPTVYGATEWALGLSRTDFGGHLLLDEVQTALEQSRTHQALRLALERRVRAGRPTILSFTSSKPSRAIRSLLPSSRDWTVALMGQPEPAERCAVLDCMAVGEGLSLSHTLTRLIAFRMRGNGRTLTGALKRLKLYGTHWQGPNAILKACGILDPFFVDNSSWDLRVVIRKASECEEFEGVRGRNHELPITVMLREVGLSEASVARFFDIEPSEAYLRSGTYERLALNSPQMQKAVSRLIERTVFDLCQESR